MDDMVSQVVHVLDEGNPFMSPTRVLHSRVRKIQRKRKPIRPATGAGKVDAFEKHKERQRKQAKDTHPNVSLRWNDGAKRWLVRQQENDEILRQTEHLNEISLRTIGIGASLGLVKSWSTKAKQGISKLKSFDALLSSDPSDLSLLIPCFAFVLHDLTNPNDAPIPIVLKLISLRCSVCRRISSFSCCLTNHRFAPSFHLRDTFGWVSFACFLCRSLCFSNASTLPAPVAGRIGLRLRCIFLTRE
jgi:hypothetical protein